MPPTSSLLFTHSFRPRSHLLNQCFSCIIAFYKSSLSVFHLLFTGVTHISPPFSDPATILPRNYKIYLLNCSLFNSVVTFTSIALPSNALSCVEISFICLNFFVFPWSEYLLGLSLLYFYSAFGLTWFFSVFFFCLV